MNGLIGRRLGRYEVVSLLGAGGMGEVYRARDTVLERDVALKVLPEAAAEDPDRLERFAREARAVARLSHPNILEIHDVGHDNDVHYAVTELLEGESLRERLGRGRLPVRKAVSTADAIARGLGAAHTQGVVHRDVKPENVLLTSDGRVKVLDFGIASLHEPEVQAAGPDASEVSTITAAGSLLGTIGYMAPEQVRGEAADARSDVFALGCVLYEMLTGERSFRRATPAETLAAVLHDEPPPPTTLTPDIPAGIGRVVMRCLEKEPGERFQSAADVAFALRAAEGSRGHRPVARRGRRFDRRFVAAAILGAAVVVAAGLAWRHISFAPPALPEQKHVAVMRFQGSGGNPELQSLADGLTESVTSGMELLEEQTRGDLWVVPARSSVQPEVQTPEGMYRNYDVTVAITGSLGMEGKAIRLRLEVLDPVTQSLLRRTVIEDSLGNVSAFQGEPVAAAARMLDLQLSQESLDRLSATGTTMGSALEHYLRGCGALRRAADQGTVTSAISDLRKSVEIDPLFAAARLSLARAHLARFELQKEASDLEEGLSSAEEAGRTGASRFEVARVMADLHAASGDVERAAKVLGDVLSTEGGSAEAFLELGQLCQKLGRLGDAERAYQRAIYLRNGFWPAHHRLGRLYQIQNRNDAAVAQFRTVVDLAPLNILGYNNLGASYYFLGRYEDAQRAWERSSEVQPNYVALSNLGALHFQESRFADAAKLFEQALALRDDDYTVWGNLAYAYRYGAAPERAESCFRKAAELAEEARQQTPKDPYVLTKLSGYLAMLDQKDRGLEVLGQAVRQHPTDPQLFADIGEAYEDLGRRELSLEWVARALQGGVPRSRFEARPTLRELVSDDRYRRLVANLGSPV